MKLLLYFCMSHAGQSEIVVIWCFPLWAEVVCLLENVFGFEFDILQMSLFSNQRVCVFVLYYHIKQWFSNFLHQVPPQKIFGFLSTTIMTNIKMQYKWLPTAPGVCVCVCVCVCVHCCVCVHFGWVKCRAQILSMSHHFHFQ